MKQLILFIFALLSLYGCVEEPRKPQKIHINEQQESFKRMIASNEEKMNSLANQLQEREFIDSLKLAMGEYMDSVKLFVNWKAKIQNINSTEEDNSIALSFELAFDFDPNQFQDQDSAYASVSGNTVEFDVDYVVPKDSIKSDKIYNTVKQLKEGSTVYFDGFIRTKANGEAHFISESFEPSFCPSWFKFFIIDISTTSKGDTLSPKLQKAVELSYQFAEPIKLNFKKKISDKEASKRTDKREKALKTAMKELPKEEKNYVRRLVQALVYNILYAE